MNTAQIMKSWNHSNIINWVGTGRLFADVEIHAGRVLVNVSEGIDRADRRYFAPGEIRDVNGRAQLIADGVSRDVAEALLTEIAKGPEVKRSADESLIEMDRYITEGMARIFA